MSQGIMAGGGMPEGSGWRYWLRTLMRLIFPRPNRHI